MNETQPLTRPIQGVKHSGREAQSVMGVQSKEGPTKPRGLGKAVRRRALQDK